MGSQCTFWCRVLTDFVCQHGYRGDGWSQCTFWCRVLTDLGNLEVRANGDTVSMHLLVPGAYRPKRLLSSGWMQSVSMHLLVPGAYRRADNPLYDERRFCLNAPSGAGCLPTRKRMRSGFCPFSSQCTFWCRVLTDQVAHFLDDWEEGLNAPSGAGCLPTQSRPSRRAGASSQCTFWCRVLTDLKYLRLFRDLPSSLNAPSGAGCLPTWKGGRAMSRTRGSQCTFWCRVLTDKPWPSP